MSATPTSVGSTLPMKLYRNQKDFWKSQDQSEKGDVLHCTISAPQPLVSSAWTFDVRASSYNTETGKWSTRKHAARISANEMIDMFGSMRAWKDGSPAAKLTIPGKIEKEVWVFTRSSFELRVHTFKPQLGHIGDVDTYHGRGTIWVEKHSLDEDDETIHVRVSNTDVAGARRMLLYLAGKGKTRFTGARGRETIGLTMFKGDFGTV